MKYINNDYDIFEREDHTLYRFKDMKFDRQNFEEINPHLRLYFYPYFGIWVSEDNTDSVDEIFEKADERLCELFGGHPEFIKNTAENIEKYNLDLTEFRKYNLSDEYIYLNPSGKYKSCTGIEKDKIQSGEVGGTTMWISKYCLARLEELKKPKESYDDVVLRLLELVDGK